MQLLDQVIEISSRNPQTLKTRQSSSLVLQLPFHVPIHPNLKLNHTKLRLPIAATRSKIPNRPGSQQVFSEALTCLLLNLFPQLLHLQLTTLCLAFTHSQNETWIMELPGVSTSFRWCHGDHNR